MKVWSVIVKIVVAMAAVAGAVYVVATYGDRIVAWAKKLLNSCPCCCDCDECDCDECDCECDCEAECDCGCTCEADAAVEEAPAETEAVAEQTDFEG